MMKFFKLIATCRKQIYYKTILFFTLSNFRILKTNISQYLAAIRNHFKVQLVS